MFQESCNMIEPDYFTKLWALDPSFNYTERIRLYPEKENKCIAGFEGFVVDGFDG